MKLWYPWNQNITYEVGTYAEYPQGFVYICIETATAGQSPVSKPLKWRLAFGSSFPGTVSSITATLPIAVLPDPITTTGTVTSSMATNKLIGRYAAGTGVMQEVTIGSGLTLSAGGTLSASLGGIAWLLDGNTVTSEKWIGTIDNFAFPVRVNNTEIWSWETNGNIFRNGNLFSRAYSTTITTWGYLAGNNNSGTNNTFIGANAGLVNAATTNNTFVGYNAGAANIASSNAFYGNQSGVVNTTGTQQSFYGTASGGGVTTGTKNTLIGYHAGEQSGTAGTGSENVVLGNNTARYLLGSFNFLAGSELGAVAGSFISGSGNIIISDHGLLTAGTTVNTCIIFGHTASASGRTSSIGIGHSVALTADNQYVMGSTSYYITEHQNFYSGSASHATYFRTSTPESAQTGNPGDWAMVNDATNGFLYLKYSGTGNTGWLALLSSSSGWVLNGNTVGSEKWIGTVDNFALPFRTNNTESMKLTTGGQLLVGNAAAAVTVSMLKLQNTSVSPSFYASNATPESAITGVRGDLVLVNDATDGEGYLKTTGTGNTGWGQIIAATANTAETITPDYTLTVKYGGQVFKIPCLLIP